MGSPAYSATSHVSVAESEDTRKRRHDMWAFAEVPLEAESITVHWIKDAMIRTKRGLLKLAEGLATKASWKGSEAQKMFLMQMRKESETLSDIEEDLRKNNRIKL